MLKQEAETFFANQLISFLHQDRKNVVSTSISLRRFDVNKSTSIRFAFSKNFYVVSIMLFLLSLAIRSEYLFFYRCKLIRSPHTVASRLHRGHTAARPRSHVTAMQPQCDRDDFCLTATITKLYGYSARSRQAATVSEFARLY